MTEEERGDTFAAALSDECSNLPCEFRKFIYLKKMFIHFQVFFFNLYTVELLATVYLKVYLHFWDFPVLLCF